MMTFIASKVSSSCRQIRNFYLCIFRSFFYPADAYNNSKLAQVFFTSHLNQIFKNKSLKIQAHSVHPGIVNTDLFENSSSDYFPWIRKFFYKTPEEGARSVVFAAISEKLEGKDSLYLSNCVEMRPQTKTKDIAESKKFFDFTCDLLGIESFEQL